MAKQISIGGYILKRRIGQGGFAEIFLGEHPETSQQVAIKVLNESFSRQPKRVQRFQEEALNASSLSHPNIIKIFRHGTQGSRHYIIMEYIHGADLSRWVEKKGALEPRRCQVILSQVCAALAHAHEQGVIHRDIKPANVLLDEEGKATLTDFGIAKAQTRSDGLTTEGSVLGTPEYMSPEQASGQDIDYRADLYAVGILAYQMVTGTLPFQSEDAIAVAIMQTKDLPEPPSARNPELSEEVDLVIGKMLCKNPEDRYQDAEEFSQDFEDAFKQPHRIQKKRKHLLVGQDRPVGFVPFFAPAATPATIAIGSFVAIMAFVAFLYLGDGDLSFLTRATPTPVAMPTLAPLPTFSRGYLEFQSVAANAEERLCRGLALQAQQDHRRALEVFGALSVSRMPFLDSIPDLPPEQILAYEETLATAEEEFAITLGLQEERYNAFLVEDLNASLLRAEALLADARDDAKSSRTSAAREKLSAIDNYSPFDYAPVARRVPEKLERLEEVLAEADEVRSSLREVARKPRRTRSGGSKDAGKLWNQAQRHYRNKDYDYAVDALDDLIAMRGHKHHSKARELRKEAKRWIEESKYAAHLREEANVLYLNGQLKAALRVVKAHLRLVPNDDRAIRLRQQIIGTMEKYDTEAPTVTGDKAQLDRGRGVLVITAIVRDDRNLKEVQACYQISAETGLECDVMRSVGNDVYRVEVKVPASVSGMGYYVEAIDEAGNIGRSQ